MKNIIATLLALVLFSPCMAQEKPRVDDSSKYYLTIITHADYAKRPAEKQLIDDISNQPMLGVAQKCHFNHYTTKDAIYQSRWASIFPESKLPVLILQDSSGGYFFKGSGSNVPSGSQNIFDVLKAFRNMDPESRTEAFLAMESISLPAPAFDDQEQRLPRRPRNDDPNPDSYEMFGGKTPIRDSLGSMSYIFLGIIVLGFMMLMAVIGSFMLYVILKFWR